jgi:[ribosomal protein S5]-alanine N-acetyltransferase
MGSTTSSPAHPSLAHGGRTYLRHPRWSDRHEFLELVAKSRRFHRPWVSPPATPQAFRAHLASLESGTRVSFLVCRRDDHGIVGNVNMNDVVRGVFQNTYLGYYALGPTAGTGYMREGLGLVLTVGFRTLGLHRMEANIIPENERSARLVQSLGFRLEGHSPRYLKIAGRWRDHDRWAITVEDWRQRRRVARGR